MTSSGRASALCVALLAAACSAPALKPPGGAAGDSGIRDAASTPDGAADGRADGGADAGPISGLDPGRTVIHRLNNLEYDNTIHDLLGIEADARKTFQSDEAGEFDNDGEAFSLNDARYEQYLNEAETLATAALADAGARQRILVCAPVTDPACFERIVRTFGARAWRRPLTDAEVSHFAQLADALAGRSADEVMAGVVQAMLSSVGFLYRIERDANPDSPVPHAVAPYELASRLSYWLWSTMPDDQLFGLAASGELAKPAVLRAQVDRMLDDARSASFVESFAGQWLGIRALLSHQVEPSTFPAFDEPLRAAMAAEMQLYFGAFLREARPFDQFPTADLNFVNARLAKHYGLDATGLGDAPVQIVNTRDTRKGYLGLAGILTAESFSYRTDPRTRGRWILRNLLCTEEPLSLLPHDQPFSPEITAATTPRGQIEAIDADGQACASCHDQFEPLGLALESFDAIGRFRTQDEHGAPVTTPSKLPDGTPISDELALVDGIAADARFFQCASHKAVVYALGRQVGASDAPHLENIRAAWKAGGRTLRDLLKEIVVNDTFRFRRGEVSP
jgi:hypothetical protein